jgi:predicted nucleotidyltransferase
MAVRQSDVERAVALAREYGATRVILFGSGAQDPAGAHDLDLACEGVGGWKLYALGARLEEELDIPVDLVPLSPRTTFVELIEKRGRVLL